VAVGVVRAVRDMRARHGISPAQKLAATIKAAGAETEALARLETLVIHMANLESLAVAADAARPALSVVQIVSGMEIYVPGLIDPAKEKARLEAQKAKLAEDLRKTEAKLSNEGFVARAPAEVVEKEITKLAEMRAQIESLEAGLKALI